MKTIKICGTLLVVLAAGACSGSKSERVWLGPDATEEDALAALDEIILFADEVFEAEGYTAYDALPGGSPVYSGVIAGIANGGDVGESPPIDYLADLRLTANFSAGTVDGTVSNFITTLDGFDDPNGTISVNGTIYSDIYDDAALEFLGSAELVQGDVTAEVYVDGYPDGYFFGSSAQVIEGLHETEFEWMTGPHVGTVSYSDGGYIAVKN